MVGGGEEIYRRGGAEQPDLGMGGDLGDESAFDRGARLVSPVEDAADRVRRLRGKVPLRGIARGRVEAYPQLIDQDFFDKAWPLLAEQPGGLGGAQARPGRENIVCEEPRRIVFSFIDDSALRPKRVAFLRLRAACQQRDFGVALR